MLLPSLLLLTAALQIPQEKAAPPPIDWLTDLDAARVLARETGRPLLAVFRCER